MKMKLAFAALAGTSLLAGCGSAVVSSLDGSAVPQQANVKSHMVSGTLNGDSISSVSDRTSNGVDTTATLYIAKVPFSDLEVPTSAEVGFTGKTDGGKTIPNSGRMRAPTSLADKALAGEDIKLSDVRYSDEDSFLQMVSTGNGWAAARYEAKSGSTGFLGYVVAGQRTNTNQMPSSGAATFNGKANATVFGSASGKQTAEGDAKIVATFAPGTGTVNGTISNIKINGNTQAYSVSLNPTAIGGNSYSGSANVVGAATSAGNYQGGFYNSDASGTAGTFHLRADGVNTGAAVENIEAVGAFGGNR